LTRIDVNRWQNATDQHVQSSTKETLINIVIEENIAAGLMSATDHDSNLRNAVREGVIPLDAIEHRDKNVLKRAKSVLTENQYRSYSVYLETQRNQDERRFPASWSNEDKIQGTNTGRVM
jgi:hypothetical protein